MVNKQKKRSKANGSEKENRHILSSMIEFQRHDQIPSFQIKINSTEKFLLLLAYPNLVVSDKSANIYIRKLSSHLI